MSQSQTGEPVSLASEKLAAIEELANTYRDQLRLTVTSQPSEVNRYINLSEIELATLTSEQCDQIGYLLAQHCLYVQNEINRNSMILKWADRNIRMLITNKLNNYGDKYTPIIHKEARAIWENPLAKELYKIKNTAEDNLSLLSDVPRRLDGIAQSFRELKYSKRQTHERS